LEYSADREKARIIREKSGLWEGFCGLAALLFPENPAHLPVRKCLPPYEFVRDPFQLSWEEAAQSRSQNVTLNARVTQGKNVKYRPFAFTEQGVAMLPSVLKSRRAVQTNVEIMRATISSGSSSMRSGN
jgi:hypothetical protein